MRLRKVLLFSAVGAFALAVGVASAQTPGAPADPPPTDPGMARQVQLSPQEQLTEADKYLARMDGARGTVRRQLAEARAERDVVKTLCLDDKLSQIDVALRSARERREALDFAAKRSDADLSNHEFTILSVLRQRVDQLSAEANQCIGNEAGFVGESSVSSTIDPDLPEEDSSDYPDFDVIIEPPACGSCTN
jgi:F0F1-type ATP synthase membrane subunit b/b'